MPHKWTSFSKCNPSLGHQNKKLTSNKLLILNDRYIGLQAGEAEELSPGDADLVDVRALPVVKATPWRKHQYPVIALLPQRLHQGGHADVHIPPQVETLWGVYVIQQVSEMQREDMRSWSFKKALAGKRQQMQALWTEWTQAWRIVSTIQTATFSRKATLIPFKVSSIICITKALYSSVASLLQL